LFKTKMSPIFLACLAAGALAGCDTREAPDTQGAEAAAGSGSGEVLAGTQDASFVGADIPVVTLTDPSGTTLALAEATGTPVLLNLWATWCAPCVVEMPLLDQLAGDLAGQVRVITVSEDLRGAEVVVPFFEQRDFQHLPQWMDTQNDLAFAFGGGAVLPLTVLYDAQGRELWRVVGGYDWGSEEARAMVLEAIANAPPPDGEAS